MSYPECVNLAEMYYLCHVFGQNGQIGKVFAWEIDIMNKK